MTDKIKHFAESIKQSFTSLPGIASFFSGLLLFKDSFVIFAFFVFFLLADYITGIVASYVEYKKTDKPDKKVYFVESERLRDSGIKVIGYLLIITFSIFINQHFYKNKIEVFGFTPPLSVLDLTLMGCLTIEFWSNIENLKRAGFDVVGKITGLADTIWNVVKKIKGNS